MLKRAKSKRSIKYLKRFLISFVILIFIVAVVAFLIIQSVVGSEQPKIYTALQNIPNKPTAIIFGAVLGDDSSPGNELRQRLEAGIELYRQGKVQNLLMTGGAAEVKAMEQYAQEKGVPASAIKADEAGLRTYDSCYRAIHQLNITDAIVVSQKDYLPRTLYLCNSLGLNSVGWEAASIKYSLPIQLRESGREGLALLKAWFDINILHPDIEGNS